MLCPLHHADGRNRQSEEASSELLQLLAHSLTSTRTCARIVAFCTDQGGLDREQLAAGGAHVESQAAWKALALLTAGLVRVHTGVCEERRADPLEASCCRATNEAGNRHTTSGCAGMPASRTLQAHSVCSVAPCTASLGGALQAGRGADLQHLFFTFSGCEV